MRTLGFHHGEMGGLRYFYLHTKDWVASCVQKIWEYTSKETDNGLCLEHRILSLGGAICICKSSLWPEYEG